MRIEDLLYRQQHNAKLAIKCDGNLLSFQEWYHRSQQLADAISKISCAESKNIAIYLPNSLEYAVAYFGILFAQKLVVPIDIQSKFPEIFSTLQYCEADLIITHSKFKENITANAHFYPFKVNILLIDTLEHIISNQNSPLTTKSHSISFSHTDDDVAIMLHTSGTLDSPKRVMLTHKNLICNIKSNVSSLSLCQEDIGLIALPLCFGYCNTAQFLTHLYLGASQIIMHTFFMPKQFFELVEKEKITNFTAVPTMLMMMLDYRYSNRYDFSTLKTVCFGGGKMPTDKLYALIQKFPTIGFVQTYGQTECSPRVTALLSVDSLRKIGSVGKPIPNVKVQILNSKNELCTPFQIGEILVSGDNIMKGYYKNIDATQKVKNGLWLHTGDLGFWDGEGYLYIAGRLKNLVISGGTNIYPEEIEAQLQQLDGVKNVLVYGKPHVELGEILCADIVLNETKHLSKHDIIQYCRSRMASYKIPKLIFFVPSIEQTYNGKNKRRVKDGYLNQFISTHLTNRAD